MARAALAIQSMSVAGIAALTMTAPNGAGAGNGNTVAMAGNQKTFLVVNNASGADRTITIPNVPVSKVGGVTLPSQTLTVTTVKLGIVWLGPLDYVASDGTIAVDIDSVTSVTWAAVQMPAAYQ